jgi:hypothetical protein
MILEALATARFEGSADHAARRVTVAPIACTESSRAADAFTSATTVLSAAFVAGARSPVFANKKASPACADLGAFADTGTRAARGEAAVCAMRLVGADGADAAAFAEATARRSSADRADAAASADAAAVWAKAVVADVAASADATAHRSNVDLAVATASSATRRAATFAVAQTEPNSTASWSFPNAAEPAIDAVSPAFAARAVCRDGASDRAGADPADAMDRASSAEDANGPDGP